jgi:hypothetical protein
MPPTSSLGIIVRIKCWVIRRNDIRIAQANNFRISVPPVYGHHMAAYQLKMENTANIDIGYRDNLLRA